MKCLRTVLFDVIQSTNVAIIRINIGLSGKLGRLINSRTPLMDGCIELHLQVSMMPMLLCRTHRSGHQCEHGYRDLTRYHSVCASGPWELMEISMGVGRGPSNKERIA